MVRHQKRHRIQDLKETLLDSVHRHASTRDTGIRQAEVKIIKTPEAERTDFGDEFLKFVDHAEHNAEHIQRWLSMLSMLSRSSCQCFASGLLDVAGHTSKPSTAVQEGR